jgi:hypothetical protein
MGYVEYRKINFSVCYIFEANVQFLGQTIRSNLFIIRSRQTSVDFT